MPGTFNEDTVFTFAITDFYTDTGAAIDKIEVQAPTAGTLWIDSSGDGTSMAEAAIIAPTQVDDGIINQLNSFLPPTPWHSYATFQFRVHDGTDFSTPPIP